MRMGYENVCYAVVQCKDAARMCYIASFIVGPSVSADKLKVRAYDHVLANVTGVAAKDVTAKCLLKSPILHCDGIVQSVLRGPVE